MSRADVLKLYRAILRTARTWGGPAEERLYIVKEAREQFHQNKRLLQPDQIAQKLREGQDRLDLGVHYGIPYPRLHHAPQFKRRQYKDPPILR